MPRRRVFNFHDDPSHGWLEVKFTTLRNHGWKPEAFTAYSYFDEDKGVVYLEQDNDAAKLLWWYEEKGFTYALREHIYRLHAPVRRLPRLDPSWPAWPDTWLPYLEKKAHHAIERDTEEGGASRRAKRVLAKERKALQRLRVEKGYEPFQERDRFLRHLPFDQDKRRPK